MTPVRRLGDGVVARLREVARQPTLDGLVEPHAFRREAQRRGATIDEVAAAALRALRQKEMGEQLTAPLDDDEAEWLDASLR